MSYKGIDISVYQGTIIDFKKVKATGVEIVYIKATEGLTYDSAPFRLQYAQAKAAGLKVGFYHYMRANDPIKEAQHFLKSTNGLQVDCKYAIDIEEIEGRNSAQISSSVRKFADYMLSQGKEVCIYTGDSFYANNLNSTVKNIPLWVAHYGVVKPNVKVYVGFQYSSTGDVDGVNGHVDVNVFYDDILIKGKSNVTLLGKPISAIKETIKYGYVTATALNVRSGSDIDFNVIGQFKKGAKVRIGNKVGSWTNVYFGDHGGWCSSEFIGSEVAAIKYPITKTVIADVLNVRSGAGTTFADIGNKVNGEKVIVERISNGFSNIRFGNHGGWVSSQYLK